MRMTACSCGGPRLRSRRREERRLRASARGPERPRAGFPPPSRRAAPATSGTRTSGSPDEPDSASPRRRRTPRTREDSERASSGTSWNTPDRRGFPAAGNHAQSRADRTWHEPRAEEARVVGREPAVVLGETELQELTGREIAQLAVARHLESFLGLSVSKRHRVPRVLDELGRHAPPAADVEDGPREKRVSPPEVGRPVDEKEDVTRLLLHDRFEDRDQRIRKEARSPTDLEETEGEEGVDAL